MTTPDARIEAEAEAMCNDYYGERIYTSIWGEAGDWRRLAARHLAALDAFRASAPAALTVEQRAVIEAARAWNARTNANHVTMARAITAAVDAMLAAEGGQR